MPRGGRYSKYIDNNAKIDDMYANFKRKCKCGHSVIVPKTGKLEFRLCHWCGGRMYRDPIKQQIYEEQRELNEFKFMLKKCINNIEKMEKERENMLNKRLRHKEFKNNKSYLDFCKRNDVHIIDTTMVDNKIYAHYYAMSDKEYDFLKDIPLKKKRGKK